MLVETSGFGSILILSFISLKIHILKLSILRAETQISYTYYRYYDRMLISGEALYAVHFFEAATCIKQIFLSDYIYIHQF